MLDTCILKGLEYIVTGELTKTRLGIKPVQQTFCFPVRTAGQRVHGLRPVDGYEEDIGRWVCEEERGDSGRLGLES